MVCAEMVSANALHFGDDRSRRMLATYPDEHPISVQLFGNDPERLAAAARQAEAAGADVVDLNCGCPVPKITKSGAGISLMKEESLFARCVSAMAKAVRVPVTVKMRLGFRRGENLAIRFACLAEEAGAAGVCVHARAQEDRHAGPPELEALAAVARAVKIPVLGNGGIHCYADALAMMERGGVAGVLVGQAAVGNPFFFWELLEAARNPADPPAIPLSQRFALLREHAHLIAEYYGEPLGIRRLRKYIPAYVKGLPGSAAFRHQANRIECRDDFFSLLNEFECSQNNMRNPT
jgi:nifR3 family TIM-barrel protein